MTGNADVARPVRQRIGQQAIAQNAAEAKASVRGMQIGVRDIRLAITRGGFAKGRTTICDDRQAAAENSRTRC